MQAIQYRKSVPRYLLIRAFGKRWPWLYTSPWACIRLTRVRPPSLPDRDWVRVRPLLSGICGSDLATVTASGSPYFSPLTSFPFVLGHEVVGEVTEVPSRHHPFREGDRVILEPALTCEIRGLDPYCRECAAGRKQRCLNTTRGTLGAGIQTGFCRDTGGAWSEAFVAHYKQLHSVPKGMPDRLAVVTEPFGCSLQALGAAPPAEGDTTLILGGGTVGILLLAGLRALGRRTRVVVVAKHPHQQALARRLGADTVMGVQDLYARLAESLQTPLLEPELGPPVPRGGAHVCFDCVGSGPTLDAALRFTRAGGTVVLVGMPGIPRNVDWTPAWHKELTVRGSYSCSTSSFRRGLELIADLGERLEGMVGARFPLTAYRAALRCALDTGRSGVAKTTFDLR